ncbi:MAG: diacylglycerol kinase family protein [Candidatus Gastranaerophilales bacterium]|nr:diacylglycerol kinase family protein [Candidatus Gastranaerophilales bacterium]
MKRQKLLLYVNPEFDTRFQSGISRLYQIFCKNSFCNLEIVDGEFLKNHVPEAQNLQILIIAGGDGTIHYVINSIPDEAFKGYLFGIIPGGTANEFAKSLNIPISLYKSADLILNSKKIYYEHLGIINNKYKFATGILYGVASQVLQITPIIAKHFFGCSAFLIGFTKYLVQYRESFMIKREEFFANNKPFRTNYLLINNASLTSKDLEKSDISLENKNEFSLIYLHSRLKLFEILKVMIRYHAHYRILQDHALAWKQMNDIKLEFVEETEFLLDGEPYKFISPMEIKFFKYPMAIIIG